jgi:cathepsin F
MAARLVHLLLALAYVTSPSGAGASGYDVIRQVTDAGYGAGLPGLLPEAQFAAFVRRHGKEYSGPEEYARRLRVFAANVARAAAHQALDPGARHGVTPFSDLTQEEFEAQLTGLVGADHVMRSLQGMPAAATVTEEEVAALPASFDWRDKGAVTEVKMQVYMYADTVRSVYACVPLLTLHVCVYVGCVRLVLGFQHDRRGGGRQFRRHGEAPQPQRAAAGRLRPHGADSTSTRSPNYFHLLKIRFHYSYYNCM